MNTPRCQVDHLIGRHEAVDQRGNGLLVCICVSWAMLDRVNIVVTNRASETRPAVQRLWFHGVGCNDLRCGLLC